MMLTADPHNVIVAGLARSGLTATCQMLSAGGMTVAGEWPAFEPYPIGAIPWGTLNGQVVKLVDTHLHLPPPGTYAVIRLRRSIEEQCTSFAKWIRVFFPSASVLDRSRTIASFHRDYETIDQWAGRQHKSLTVDFERIIESTSDVATELIGFLEMGLDHKRMVASIIARSTACYDGLLELDMIGRGF